MKKHIRFPRKLLFRLLLTRPTLENAFRHLITLRLEQQHRQGYQNLPFKPGEVGAWQKEQAWGDE